MREGTQRESDLEVERGAASLEAARLRTANDALRRRISSVDDEGTLSFEADELRVELEQARCSLHDWLGDHFRFSRESWGDCCTWPVIQGLGD